MKSLNPTAVNAQKADSFPRNDRKYPIKVAVVDDDANERLLMRRVLDVTGEFVCVGDVLTGRRRLPQMGNASLSTHWVLNELPIGIYYWSVQSIDQSFTASTFSAEQTFVIAPAANEPSLIRSGRLLSIGEFAPTVIGNPGTDYAIDISNDLALWTQWRLVQSSNAVIAIGDSDVVFQGAGFYRARQSP